MNVSSENLADLGFVVAVLVLVYLFRDFFPLARTWIEYKRRELALLTTMPLDITASAVEKMSLGELRTYATLNSAVSDLMGAAQSAASTKDERYGMRPDDVVELENGTQVKFKDIPKLPNGEVDPAWLAEHCPCDVHGGKGSAPDDPGGLYL